MTDALETDVPTPTSAAIHTRVPGAARPRDTIIIVHGMVKHTSRYAHSVISVVEEGYAVLTDDHHGYGATATPGGFGFIVEEGG